MTDYTSTKAAQFLGCRQDNICRQADLGRIPFRWQLDAYGSRHRVFKRDDLQAYLDRQRGKLRARLEKLDALATSGEAA